MIGHQSFGSGTSQPRGDTCTRGRNKNNQCFILYIMDHMKKSPSMKKTFCSLNWAPRGGSLSCLCRFQGYQSVSKARPDHSGTYVQRGNTIDNQFLYMDHNVNKMYISGCLGALQWWHGAHLTSQISSHLYQCTAPAPRTISKQSDENFVKFKSEIWKLYVICFHILGDLAALTSNPMITQIWGDVLSFISIYMYNN